MPTALEQYQAGRLNEAVQAAVEEVKNKPGDLAARWLLCEMLCFAGELDRVDKHLDLITQQDPRAGANAALYRQLVRAEIARQQFFSDGRVPQLLAEPTQELKLRLEASIRIREGAHSEAAKLLDETEEKRLRLSGQQDGKHFEDLRDLDDLTASVFEVLTSTGKYYWIPMEKVRELEFRKPQRARDLLWRQAHMAVEGGPTGEVYLPALYPGSHASGDDHIRLGRSTDWTGGNGAPTRGVGQRMFLVGDDTRGIGELGRIQFQPVEVK